MDVCTQGSLSYLQGTYNKYYSVEISNDLLALENLSSAFSFTFFYILSFAFNLLVFEGWTRKIDIINQCFFAIKLQVSLCSIRYFGIVICSNILQNRNANRFALVNQIDFGDP